MTLVAGRLAAASGEASGPFVSEKEERRVQALPQTPSHGKVREGARETGHEHGARGRGSRWDGNRCPALSRDTLSRLTGLSAIGPGPTTITDFDYTYDAAGNRLTKAQLDYTEAYTYDPLYRLTDVARTGALTGEWHYRYDPVGNRLSAQVNSAVTTSTYNEKNQLVSSTGGGPLRVRGILDEPGTAKVNGVPASMVSGNAFEATIQATTGTNTFTVEATDYSGNVNTESYSVTATGTGATQTYDANGNLTQKVEGGVTWTYVWDAENRLKWVCNTTPCSQSASVASFAYDPLGRRVEKVAGSVTTAFAYDGDDILRQIAGSSPLKYVHGPNIDEPIAQEDGAGALSYLHADGLGSLVKITNSAAAVVSTRRYDAYGALESGSANGYGFTGREWDSEAGLYYYRARYYDPKIGRFISEDPIRFAGGINFYVYVGGNPGRFIDPFGLEPCDCSGQPALAPGSGGFGGGAAGLVGQLFGAWGVVEGGAGYFSRSGLGSYISDGFGFGGPGSGGGVTGAFLGVGLNGWISNAECPSQLGRTTRTFLLNIGSPVGPLGIGDYEGSISFSWGNGIWHLSVNPPTGVPASGMGIGAGAGVVPTTTRGTDWW